MKPSEAKDPSGRTLEWYLAGTVAAIHATRFEKATLWEKHAVEGTSSVWMQGASRPLVNERRFIWRHEMGWGVDAGGTQLHLSFNLLNGQRVMFWHTESRQVDFAAVDVWLASEVPKAQRADADNFREIFHKLER